MKIQSRIARITMELEVPTYVADDGSVIELTDEELNKGLKDEANKIVKRTVTDRKYFCRAIDYRHEFNSFKQNCKGLTYDEEDKESYKHFVHEYLKKYYVDSSGSRHYTNGGHWQHFSYNVELGLHDRMISGAFDKGSSSDLGVKDLITIHLMSGRGVRMYGTGLFHRRIRRLETESERKEFWRWVFDSKMIDPNGPVIASCRMQQLFENGDYFNHYKNWFDCYPMFGPLIVYKCWRDNSLDVLKWIVKEYGLDLYKIEEMTLTNGRESLLAGIIREIHDYRIHDTYNNSVLCRLYDYSTKKLKPIEERNNCWVNKSFDRLIEFTKFITGKWPGLTLRSFDGKDYASIEEFMRENLLKRHLDSSIIEKGERESAESLISAILKD